jgi:serine/threonine protein kinase
MVFKLVMSLLGMSITLILFPKSRKNLVFHRWWRAPEIYINWEQYNEKLDIWSAGCVMAELILLEPVFRGSDYIDQLNKIFNILGTPNLATLNEICTAGS